MSRALRRWLLAIAILLIAGGAAFAFVFEPKLHGSNSDAGAKRENLLLLTSLPLIFNEQFSLEGGGSPALTALRRRYRVVPISVTDEKELNKGPLLLMAHPLAQPAEDLVALDNWVRRGGRVLLLADPLLEWPSKRALGDPLRPPPMFMDTGLLKHWGLSLSDPVRRGPQIRTVAGFQILAVSPGELSGGCDISPDRLLAHCRIGKGQATVIADADFLDTPALGPGGAHNLDALLAELARLQRN